MRCEPREPREPGELLEDDNIVTRFCEVVTARYTAAKLRRARLATKDVGEAMAPASAPTPAGSGAGAAPVVAGTGSRALGALAFAMVLACGDAAQPRTRPAEIAQIDRSAADPARGITTELDGTSPAFGTALLAELTGDVAAARAGFERVLAAGETPSPLAARAA